jgi:lysophospholipase L1-like esterase
LIQDELDIQFIVEDDLMKRTCWLVGLLVIIFVYWTGLRLSRHRMNRDMDWQQTHFYAEKNKHLQNDDPTRVVFFGDSITSLWATELFFAGKPYIDRGIPEQTTSQMLLRFRQDVIDLRPKAVVILAGTNDVLHFYNPVATKIAEGNIESMVELAKLHGIRVILCSLPPTNYRNGVHNLDFSENVRALNLWLRNYSAKEDLSYVDYYAAMDDGTGTMKDGMSVDGIHPSELGYRIMGPLVQAAIDMKQ